MSVLQEIYKIDIIYHLNYCVFPVPPKSYLKFLQKENSFVSKSYRVSCMGCWFLTSHFVNFLDFHIFLHPFLLNRLFLEWHQKQRELREQIELNGEHLSLIDHQREIYCKD